MSEEARVFSLHPQGNRMLIISTVYAAGEDASAHAQTMLDLLASIE
jgi:hypothetical protein